MHLRPAVRRLTVSWIAAVIIVPTMAVGIGHDARQVVGACWLGVGNRVLPHSRSSSPAGGTIEAAC
jgi:hypothetical protein